MTEPITTGDDHEPDHRDVPIWLDIAADLPFVEWVAIPAILLVGLAKGIQERRHRREDGPA